MKMRTRRVTLKWCSRLSLSLRRTDTLFDEEAFSSMTACRLSTTFVFSDVALPHPLFQTTSHTVTPYVPYPLGLVVKSLSPSLSPNLFSGCSVSLTNSVQYEHYRYLVYNAIRLQSFVFELYARIFSLARIRERSMLGIATVPIFRGTIERTIDRKNQLRRWIMIQFVIQRRAHS